MYCVHFTDEAGKVQREVVLPRSGMASVQALICTPQYLCLYTVGYREEPAAEVEGWSQWVEGRPWAAAERLQNEPQGQGPLTFGWCCALLLCSLLKNSASGLIHPLSAERGPEGLFTGRGWHTEPAAALPASAF